MLAASNSFWDQYQGVIVGPAVGVVGAIASFVYFLNNRPKKQLEWATRFSRIEIDPNVAEVLKVTHFGIPVVDPCITTVRIANTGRQEIKEDDFRSNITIRFDESVSVLSISVLEDSDGVKRLLPVDARDQTLTVANTYFNRASWIEIQVVTDGGTDKSVEAKCVVLGQTRPIRRRTAVTETRRLLTFAVLAAVTFSAAVVVTAILNGPQYLFFVFTIILFATPVAYLTQKRLRLFDGYTHEPTTF